MRQVKAHFLKSEFAVFDEKCSKSCGWGGGATNSCSKRGEVFVTKI